MALPIQANGNGEWQLRIWEPSEEPSEGPLGRKSKLSKFWLNWYLQTICIDLRGNSEATIKVYNRAVAWWIKVTFDPPICEITRETMADFRHELLQQLATSSAREYLTKINAILSRTAGGEFDDCLPLLNEAPHVQLPEPDPPQLRGVYTVPEIRAMIDYGAPQMHAPMLFICPDPALWWATFLTVCYLQGWRFSEMLVVRFCHLVDGVFRIPADLVKTRRPLIREAHAESLQAIDAIRSPDRDRIWPWHVSKNWQKGFYRALKRLMLASGLPEDRCFGVHGFRRAHAGNLDPVSAQESLGHARWETTRTSYRPPEIPAARDLSLQGGKDDGEATRDRL